MPANTDAHCCSFTLPLLSWTDGQPRPLCFCEIRPLIYNILHCTVLWRTICARRGERERQTCNRIVLLLYINPNIWILASLGVNSDVTLFVSSVLKLSRSRLKNEGRRQIRMTGVLFVWVGLASLSAPFLSQQQPFQISAEDIKHADSGGRGAAKWIIRSYCGLQGTCFKQYVLMNHNCVCVSFFFFICHMKQSHYMCDKDVIMCWSVSWGETCLFRCTIKLCLFNVAFSF